MEIPDTSNVEQQIASVKKNHPGIIIAVRIIMDEKVVRRVDELSKIDIEAIHLIADLNGNEIGTKSPRFIKDVLREDSWMLNKK